MFRLSSSLFFTVVLNLFPTFYAGTGQFYGFHGSRTSQYPLDKQVNYGPVWYLEMNSIYDVTLADVIKNFKFFLQDVSFNASHLASTYCALAILKIIGYDFSNLDSTSISMSMKNLQHPDGRYRWSQNPCLW